MTKERLEFLLNEIWYDEDGYHSDYAFLEVYNCFNDMCNEIELLRGQLEIKNLKCHEIYELEDA